MKSPIFECHYRHGTKNILSWVEAPDAKAAWEEVLKQFPGAELIKIKSC